MKNSIPSSQTLMDLLVSSVADIVRYSVKMKRHECEVLVREKLNEVRTAEFNAAAGECALVTRQLNLYKTKLNLLEMQIAEYPDDLKEICRPLIDELKNKILACRVARKASG